MIFTYMWAFDMQSDWDYIHYASTLFEEHLSLICVLDNNFSYNEGIWRRLKIKMRRADREVKELKEIVAIMEKCDVCRIALNDDGYPYILPLNFGMYVKDEKIELYFHGALEGTKYDLIKKDNRASFEMDCGHHLVTNVERGNCTMEYESVIGQGHIELLSDDEKYDALCILMKQYHKEGFPFNQEVMTRTQVFKLVVEKMTGKIRKKKK